VHAKDPRQGRLQDSHHVPEFDRLESEHFFTVYNGLEPGKSVEGSSWVGRTAAQTEIEASYERFRLNGGY
jgi:inorganic pyrophosphatase